MREASTISRQSEFFSELELTKQLGFRRELWPVAICSELIANSLDHCEEIGRLPEITVKLSWDTITVADNGDGIPSKVVEKMIDFDSLTSSRRAIVSPSRGRQGNFGKCLLAAQCVTGGKNLIIDAANVSHYIEVRLDQVSRMPSVLHLPSEKVQNGTTVNIHIPCHPKEDRDRDFVLLCWKYAVLNPHVTFKFIGLKRDRTFERTTSICTKWTPGHPEPAHWYELESITERMAAARSIEKESGRLLTVNEFLKGFAGMTRSDARKLVCDETGTTRAFIAHLVNGSLSEKESIQAILDSMQKHSTPPKPLKLGSIGRNHVIQLFQDQSVSDPKYIRLQGFTDKNLPFVIEAAFGTREISQSPLRVTGINFAPDITDPSIRLVQTLLERQRVDEKTKCVFLFHLTTPSPNFTNRGKSILEPCEALTAAIEKAVIAVTKAHAASVKALELSASRPAKRTGQCSLKDAIYQFLPDAIAQVSVGGKAGFNNRNLYYAIRKLIQSVTDSPLEQKRMDKVLDEYESENGLIEGRQRDPRGYLLEPHTGRQIPLGTRNVDAYEIPEDLYHSILYCEKKGLLPNFQFGKIGEKYDAAIVCAEGFAVRAAQKLMQAASRGHAIKVFVFHDCDPSGYMIAKAIGSNSGAHKFNYEVIDAGLTLDEALAMGLETEKFDRKKALPSKLQLTALEQELFGGTEKTVISAKSGKTKQVWIDCERIELNALAAYPERFVTWVEQKLDRHGAKKKLIPSKPNCKVYLDQRFKDELSLDIRYALEKQLSINEIVARINDQIKSPTFKGAYSNIAAWSKDLLPYRWTDRANSIIDDAIKVKHEEVQRLVIEQIEERFHREQE